MLLGTSSCGIIAQVTGSFGSIRKGKGGAGSHVDLSGGQLVWSCVNYDQVQRDGSAMPLNWQTQLAGYPCTTSRDNIPGNLTEFPSSTAENRSKVKGKLVLMDTQQLTVCNDNFIRCIQCNV